MGLREDLHALVDRIADALEKGHADDWVDQKHSPLGREKHLSLVKRGKLPGVKEGKQVLVRRSDLDAYLAAHPVIVVDESAEIEAEAARLVATFERKRG